MIVSKVSVFLLNRLILPSGVELNQEGSASSLHSRIVFHTGHIFELYFSSNPNTIKNFSSILKQQ